MHIIDVLRGKVGINIQSFSDIITNSSSEIFCTINTDDKNVEEFIYDIISNVITPNGDSELEPSLTLFKKNNEEKEWYTEEEWDKLPESQIQIHLPYSSNNSWEFYKAGLKAILDVNNISKEDYKIEFY